MHTPTSADEARRPHARPLPQGRAILGGLLVVAAVAVAGFTTRDDPADHRRPYLTAASSFDRGHVIEATDLATAALDLDPGVEAGTFTDGSSLVGVVVISPVSAGELIQHSDLALATTTDRPDRAALEVTFPVERDRAPRSLQPGEHVTVLATHTAAGGSTTNVAVDQALVVAYERGEDGFSASGTAVLTIALASTDDHLAVVHDTQVGALTVIRANSRPSATPTAPGDSDE
ncbi:MAG: SAF domain-containing protein [Acidimicrobiales bacterium]